ncbi:hypothetical protein MtrunA17_Chr2g0318401 [Medicago truncatula]|uniref:Uncharacterized protein n=1 Tax=Medicago truncatula TaxID=3880 RepID=A0A396JFP6_MEDTR|nr:hypothetical protein MtrunA17_Chr2g0318401 [Medicago truncatula]
MVIASRTNRKGKLKKTKARERKKKKIQGQIGLLTLFPLSSLYGNKFLVLLYRRNKIVFANSQRTS